MQKDLYKVLGLSKDASDDEIKKAFRRLAVQYHPDKQNGKTEQEQKEAEEKFKEINEAYSVLSDTEKRKQYDMYGTVGEQPGGFGGGMDGFSEFFRHMHNPFGGFENFGGFYQQQPQNTVVNGTNIRIKVQCSLEDIYNGVSKTIKFKRNAKCPDCNGSGSKTNEVTVCPKCHGTGIYRQVSRSTLSTQIIEGLCPDCHGTGKIVKDKCHKCNGTGLVEVTETITFNIPKDALFGNYITKQGLGNEAPNNLGNAGDLIIVFELQQNMVFGIAENGTDLYCKTEVGILDCITGGEKEVSCIDGTKVTIKIPKFSKENSKIVVNGKGMPKRNGGYGNMIVYLQHKMPTDLSKDEIKLIEELKKQKHFKK